MKKLLIILFTLSACTGGPSGTGGNESSSSSSSESSSSSSSAAAETSSQSSGPKYLAITSACYRSIPNQGKIPAQVLNNITDFVRSAPDQVFEKNNEADIYSLFNKYVGPFTTLKQRRAVMADTEIVLGAMESSWNYGIGRDPNTPATKPCDEWEAGMFQTSSNTLANFGNGKLTALFDAACKDYKNLGTCQGFQKCTKEEPAFAHAYTGLLLRYTTRHHGPITNGFVGPLLSKTCENEIEGIL